MPVVKMNKVGKESSWALWLISETESELTFHVQETCPEEIVSSLKRLEWLSGRALVKSLLEKQGLEYQGLRKDEFGKPFLKENDHQISISHSYPYVAVQIHSSKSVGIDLEQPKEKLLRIAHRVLSPEELKDAGKNVTKHCVYWCAKETMYKIYGRRGLHFETQLNLVPFQLQKNGLLKGKVNAPDLQTDVELAYVIESEYVMVYTNFE
jgi:4'-phosphopantetheinyl transferase